MRHRSRRGTGKNAARFWNKEYKTGTHLALSAAPAEDLVKFARFLFRRSGKEFLNPTVSVLDLGCGNGRNLIYLAETFGVRGVGYDISEEAIAQAKRRSRELPLSWSVRPLAEPIPLANESQSVVLDMMASHVLSEDEREYLRAEIVRVLKPGGWLLLKTFLRDKDLHARRLLKEHPAEEAGSYVHPELGIVEHVFGEDELLGALEEDFTVHKVQKSHKHLREGRAWKRRSIVVYAERNY